MGGERAPHPSRGAEVNKASRLGSLRLKKVMSRTQRLQAQEQGSLETGFCTQSTANSPVSPEHGHLRRGSG